MAFRPFALLPRRLLHPTIAECRVVKTAAELEVLRCGIKTTSVRFPTCWKIHKVLPVLYPLIGKIHSFAIPYAEMKKIYNHKTNGRVKFVLLGKNIYITRHFLSNYVYCCFLHLFWAITKKK